MSLSPHCMKANEKNQTPKFQELQKENRRNKHLGLSEQSKCLGKVTNGNHQKASRAPSRRHSNATGSKSHLVPAGNFLPSTSVSSLSNTHDGKRDEADLDENLCQFGTIIGNYIRYRRSRPGSHVTINELNDELRKANVALKKKEGTQIGRIWKLMRLVEGLRHFNGITVDYYKEIIKNKGITDHSKESQTQRPTVIMSSACGSAKRHTDHGIQILNEELVDYSSVPCDDDELWTFEVNQDVSFETLDSQLAELFHEESSNDDQIAYDLSIQNVGQTYASETKTMFEERYD